ncbi:MAG: VIT domain-containing protein [Bacteroidia bacterium]|nr:VIT domain-containing protein [Bacteroidia bacterium]
MKAKVTLLLLLISVSGCKPSQKVTQTTPPATVVMPANTFPAILVKTDEDSASHPLSISEISLDVKVTGNMATTTMDLLFYNPTDRLLEGQWYFPLAEDQTITRFAMEVNGKLREGVAVEKTQARIAYEQTVRQQIDPGLAEWSQGNHFKARIYPIPAEGYKRIVIAYQQELFTSIDGWLYQLPLNFPEKVKKFSVNVEVFKQEIKPKTDKNELANLFFNRWEEAYRASQTYTDFRPDQLLAFAVPKGEEDHRVWIEGISRDSAWFYLTTEVPAIERESRPYPARVCVLWDQSHSASGRDQEKELAVLDQYFQSVGNPEILLVPFHIRAQPVLRFSGQEKAAFAQTVRKLPHDGATSLGALKLENYVADEFILVSDGISTFGENELIVPPGKPVFTMASGNAADFSFLRHLARSSGGKFLNLNPLTHEEAVKALSLRPLQFISANYNSQEVSLLTPSMPQDINGTFSLAGVMRGDEATLTLNYGFDGKILRSQTVYLDRLKDAVQNINAGKIWAGKILREMDIQPEKNRAKILAIGKKFSLLTRQTSLVVLDRVEDYVAHEITPPEELRETYTELLNRKKENEKFEMLSHLDLIAEGFYQRKEWWEKEFAIPTKPYIQEPKRDNQDRLLDSGAVEADSDGVPDFGDFDDLAAAEPIDKTEEEADNDKKSLTGEITLKEWDPDMPWIRKLKENSGTNAYEVYLELKPLYSVSPAFFLDVADFFRKEGEADLALLILSNIAEMELENHELLRVLARRLQQLELWEEAAFIFRKITEIRPEEPQSWRDLGLVMAEKGQYQESVNLLYKVVSTPWDGRFPEIGVLAAHEMNAVIARSLWPLDLQDIDERLLADLPTDIRVVLDWDADAVDMDLWVTDPRGEKCYYQHKLTEIGGMISTDFTGGYGPEEFLLKKAMKGKYKVQVNYYGTRQQRIAGPTNIQLKLITGYGRKNQESKQITLRLEAESQVIEVGEFSFE